MVLSTASSSDHSLLYRLNTNSSNGKLISKSSNNKIMHETNGVSYPHVSSSASTSSIDLPHNNENRDSMSIQRKQLESSLVLSRPASLPSTSSLRMAAVPIMSATPTAAASASRLQRIQSSHNSRRELLQRATTAAKMEPGKMLRASTSPPNHHASRMRSFRTDNGTDKNNNRNFENDLKFGRRLALATPPRVPSKPVYTSGKGVYDKQLGGSTTTAHVGGTTTDLYNSSFIQEQEQEGNHNLLLSTPAALRRLRAYNYYNDFRRRLKSAVEANTKDKAAAMSSSLSSDRTSTSGIDVVFSVGTPNTEEEEANNNSNKDNAYSTRKATASAAVKSSRMSYNDALSINACIDHQHKYDGRNVLPPDEEEDQHSNPPPIVSPSPLKHKEQEKFLYLPSSKRGHNDSTEKKRHKNKINLLRNLKRSSNSGQARNGESAEGSSKRRLTKEERMSGKQRGRDSGSNSFSTKFNHDYQEQLQSRDCSETDILTVSPSNSSGRSTSGNDDNNSFDNSAHSHDKMNGDGGRKNKSFRSNRNRKMTSKDDDRNYTKDPATSKSTFLTYDDVDAILNKVVDSTNNTCSGFNKLLLQHRDDDGYYYRGEEDDYDDDDDYEDQEDDEEWDDDEEDDQYEDLVTAESRRNMVKEGPESHERHKLDGSTSSRNRSNQVESCTGSHALPRRRDRQGRGTRMSHRFGILLPPYPCNFYNGCSDNRSCADITIPSFVPSNRRRRRRVLRRRKGSSRGDDDTISKDKLSLEADDDNEENDIHDKEKSHSKKNLSHNPYYFRSFYDINQCGRINGGEGSCAIDPSPYNCSETTSNWVRDRRERFHKEQQLRRTNPARKADKQDNANKPIVTGDEDDTIFNTVDEDGTTFTGTTFSLESIQKQRDAKSQTIQVRTSHPRVILEHEENESSLLGEKSIEAIDYYYNDENDDGNVDENDYYDDDEEDVDADDDDTVRRRSFSILNEVEDAVYDCTYFFHSLKRDLSEQCTKTATTTTPPTIPKS